MSLPICEATHPKTGERCSLRHLPDAEPSHYTRNGGSWPNTLWTPPPPQRSSSRSRSVHSVVREVDRLVAERSGHRGPPPQEPGVIIFTQADINEAERLAQIQYDTARSKGTPRINNFRTGDHVAAISEGFLGEWAVADALGVPREADLSGVADDGADIRVGMGINVRSTPYKTGRLMCPANRPFHNCRWVVLVICSDDRMEFTIAGGLSVEEFYRACSRRDFGYGPTDYVTQAQLLPWDELSVLIRALKKSS